MTSPIALVLTCDRPFYQARFNRNLETFERLKRNGFRIVLLHANPTLVEATFSQDVATGYELLTVPTAESYDNLSNKMSMAYRALWSHPWFMGAPGILKMDDCTR